MRARIWAMLLVSRLLKPSRGRGKEGGAWLHLRMCLLLFEDSRPILLLFSAALRNLFFFNIFFFFFKMGFHHVGQAGLELPTSGEPPALASKVLGLQA